MAAVAVIASGAGYFVARQLSYTDHPADWTVRPVAGKAPAVADTSQLVGQRRPDFSLSDAAGRPVLEDAYNGRVLLTEFQRDHAARVTVAGIAVDDPARAREFARELGVGYPLLFGQPEAMLISRSYGNHSGMLPYSVLVDASGIVLWTRLGAVDRVELEAQLAALPDGDA